MEWLPPGWCPRVVAFDIDGTLTDEKKRLDMHAVEALRRLEDAGIPVILATGNVRAITYGLWRFIGLSGPMCCENGGVLWHPSWDGPLVRASGAEAKMLQNGLQNNILKLIPMAFRPMLGERASGACSLTKTSMKLHPVSKQAIGQILTWSELDSLFTSWNHIYPKEVDLR